MRGGARSPLQPVTAPHGGRTPSHAGPVIWRLLLGEKRGVPGVCTCCSWLVGGSPGPSGRAGGSRSDSCAFRTGDPRAVGCALAIRMETESPESLVAVFPLLVSVSCGGWRVGS